MDSNTKQMIVRKALSKYRSYAQQIFEMELKLEEINTRAYAMKTAQLNAMPRGGSPHTNFDDIEKKSELERKIKRMMKVAGQRRKVVQAFISTVRSSVGRQYLAEYYIGLKSVEEIAAHHKVSISKVYRIKRAAESNINLSVSIDQSDCG
jgi:Mg2+ and Co2+ transporter CorA